MKYFLTLVFAATAFGQDYVAIKTTALSGAVEAITIQQPASAARTVKFARAWVDCSVACTVTIARNGTAASSTTLATVPLISTSAASAATAWSASNVGTGTSAGVFAIPAGGGVPIDLTGFVLSGSGTTKNLTISTNSITGTVHIIIRWTESQ